MNEYVPELGQRIFGRPSKEFKCPLFIVAVLQAIDNELEHIMRDVMQTEYKSPFSNSGESFVCPAF